MKTARILIVEDNRIVAEDIKQTLVKLGYTVSGIATSGKKALALVKTVPVDIALMDINLGKGINGISVAEQFNKEYQIPVIYLTAHADRKTIDRAKKTEPFGYLVKPFGDQELQSTVEVALYKYQANIRVKKNEQWLGTILRSIGDGVITTDRHGNVNYLNPVAETLTGWKSSDAVGNPLETVFHIVDEVSRNRIDNRVEKILQTDGTVDPAGQTLLISKNGGALPVKESGSPIVMENGEITGVVIVFQDDTKNKAAEQALRASEEKYRTFVENFQGIAFRGYEDLSIDFMTGNVESITGYTDLDFISGKVSYKDLIHPDDRERVNRAVNTFMSARATSDHREYRIIDKNGHTRWVSGNISKIQISDDDIRVDGTIQDITERKTAESQIRLLKTAVEQSVESICITDTRGRIEYINAAFETVSGYSQKELIGLSPSILKSGKHTKDFYADLWQTLTRKQIWTGIFINKKKDGTLYHEKASVSPVLDNNREVTHYIAVKRDITEEMAKEKMLRQSQKMESIGTLAGGIAHDFNNILSPILGFSQLSMGSVEKGSVLEDNLNEITKAAMRAKELVRQILTFARRSDEGISPIKINPVVKETLKFMRSSLPMNVDIQSDIGNCDHVMADPTQIHQIVMNLCTNAFHALNDESGVIKVILKNIRIKEDDDRNRHGLKPGSYVLLSVSDTGAGIASENVNMIFEPYFTTKASGEGTGLGLAVCQGAVKSMNGEIFVESTRDVGTCFTIYLPVSDPPSHSARAMMGKEKIARGTESILFVDDEQIIAKMTKKILEGLDYTVTAKTSSVEAFSVFRSDPGKFDLVITDMAMPDMTGDVLVKKIKKIRSDVPVILCTGFSQKISEEEIKQIGIDAYCRKPLSIPVLAAKVRHLLDESGPGAS